MSDISVSIVVPVYKVEQYIHKCVDSIRKQDYENIEIILVDDGSPDQCPQICDELAKTDSRIKVIHKKNGGLSDARNAGVAKCTSEYVLFVDSDDYIDSDYVSSLIECKEKFGADIACSPLIFEYKDGIGKKREAFEEKCIGKLNAMQIVMRARYGIGVTACSKLYPAQALKEHPFPVGVLHEDIAVVWDIFECFDKVAITPKATYHYVQRKESITHKTIGFSSLYWILDFIQGLMYRYDNKALKEACAYRMFELVNEICRVAEIRRDKDDIKKIQRMIRPLFRCCVDDPLNSIKTKTKMFLLSHSLVSFSLFCFFKTKFTG